MSWRARIKQDLAARGQPIPPMTGERIAELQERIDEIDSTPQLPRFGRKLTRRGRWFIAYEWYGGFVSQSETSLSRARRICNIAKNAGAKWTYLRRNKRHAMSQHFKWLFARD